MIVRLVKKKKEKENIYTYCTCFKTWEIKVSHKGWNNIKGGVCKYFIHLAYEYFDGTNFSNEIYTVYIANKEHEYILFKILI